MFGFECSIPESKCHLCVFTGIYDRENNLILLQNFILNLIINLLKIKCILLMLSSA